MTPKNGHTGRKPPEVELPHSAEIEAALLGSILVSGGQTIPECVAHIQPHFFYVPAHRVVYQALLDMHDSVGAIDLEGFTQFLRDRDLLETVGGAANVTGLYAFVPTDVNLGYYIDIVKGKFLLREIIETCTSHARRASESGANGEVEEPLNLLDEIESSITSIRSLGRKGAAISFRSPAEILALPHREHANFLGDHLLGIGLSLVIAGIGGIGKSRLFLQLLVAFVLERFFCGIETHHTKGKPWMLIQTQNPITRLQDDLEPLRKYAGRDWPLVEKNLIIHTLETDRDLMLHLSDPRNVRDLEGAIRRYNPIGIAFDPLNEIGIGDLSKDVDMTETCREIGRISRAGNPERAILLATHALTGLAGMKKAFGFEAAGFGRNSKVLQTWARAFINVVPGAEDYSVLILTCGKNNNGKMFPPFAIRLNPDTMIYEPEPDFDIEAFREQLKSDGKRARTAYEPEIITEMEWPEPEGGGKRGLLDKAQLARAIVEEIGCHRATAYRLIDMAATQRLVRFNKTTRIYAKK